MGRVNRMPHQDSSTKRVYSVKTDEADQESREKRNFTSRDKYSVGGNQTAITKQGRAGKENQFNSPFLHITVERIKKKEPCEVNHCCQYKAVILFKYKVYQS